MKLEHYIAQRRIWELGLWVVFLCIVFAANSITSWVDLGRGDSEFHNWEPIVWEFTSSIVQGFLILLVLRFDQRFPIRIDTWRINLIAHTLFTLVYALIHVTLMYWMRVFIYRLIGNNDGYWWPHWWTEFAYEYLKDFRTYFFIISVIYLYRFILLRLQGEAGYLVEGQEETEPTDIADRFLIKKLGREFLIKVDDIDWIESSGNYVNLHVGEHVYPLRETMTNITKRLASQGFQRVHRSAIINLERVSELSTLDSNDGEVRLDSGIDVPVSRRLLKALRTRLQS